MAQPQVTLVHPRVLPLPTIQRSELHTEMLP